jgi:uncharacterized protein (TIGR00730 family)
LKTIHFYTKDIGLNFTDPFVTLDSPMSIFKSVQTWVSHFQQTFIISSEFWRGFRFFRNSGPTITIFGSARFEASHRYCLMAEELAYQLGESGYTILTGGGPSIMGAGNKGARRAKAVSLGCRVQLPFEQAANPSLDRVIEMRYFFSRKAFLTQNSKGYVFFPGGFGTLDELFDVLTLIQTRKIPKAPVVLVGQEFWAPLDLWMRERLLTEKVIDQSAIQLYEIDDDLRKISHFFEAALRPKRDKITEMPART